MFDLMVFVLESIGLCAFVMTGAIVAARRNMDVIGFVLLGTVTGIGGGTTRDVILGRFPVWWVKAQNQCRMTLETLSAIKNPPVVYSHGTGCSREAACWRAMGGTFER